MNKKISNNNVPLNINSILKMGLRYWYIFIISGIISVGIGGIYFKMSRPVLKFMANIIIKEEGGNKSAISTMMLKSFPFGNLGSVKVNDELLLLNTFTFYSTTSTNNALGIPMPSFQPIIPKEDDFEEVTAIISYSGSSKYIEIDGSTKFEYDLHY